MTRVTASTRERQYTAALVNANAVRMEFAALTRKIGNAQEMGEAIDSGRMDRFRVGAVLRATPRVGAVKQRRVLETLKLNPYRRIGDLVPRQKRALVDLLTAPRRRRRRAERRPGSRSAAQRTAGLSSANERRSEVMEARMALRTAGDVAEAFRSPEGAVGDLEAAVALAQVLRVTRQGAAAALIRVGVSPVAKLRELWLEDRERAAAMIEASFGHYGSNRHHLSVAEGTGTTGPTARPGALERAA